MSPEHGVAVEHRQRRAARHADLRRLLLQVRRHVFDQRCHRVDGAFHDAPPAEVDAAEARLGGERDELARDRRHLGLVAEAARQVDHGAPFRRLVGQRRDQRREDQLPVAVAADRDELGREPVAERDRAGLVHDQRVDVAGGLDGAPRHGEHVVLHEPVHARDADGREQPADRGRDEADEQRDQRHRGHVGADEAHEGTNRHHREQEDDREAREQDVERDLVRRLLTLGAFDQRDHAVEEGLAGVGRDADAQPVAGHGGAGRDRAANVGAGLLEHGSGLAGDRGLADERDALDHVAVARDRLAGRDADHVALAQLRSSYLFERTVRPLATRHRVAAHRPQRVGLRLATPLSHGLGEVGEQHREPEPGRNRDRKRLLAAGAGQGVERENRRDHGADLDDQHDGVTEQVQRVQLDDRVVERPAHDVAAEDRDAGLALARDC